MKYLVVVFIQYLFKFIYSILTILFSICHRFNLKTRWTTKSDQKTLFDSLQLFVCGLANPDCTPALVQIARSSSGAEIQYWVKKRQELILQLLKRLSNKNNLTGPKVKYKPK